jgi:hypothetical protein
MESRHCFQKRNAFPTHDEGKNLVKSRIAPRLLRLFRRVCHSSFEVFEVFVVQFLDLANQLLKLAPQ